MSRIDDETKKEVDCLADVPPPRFSYDWRWLPPVAQFVCVAILGSFQFGYSFSALNTSKNFIIIDLLFCGGDSSHLFACTGGSVMGSLITGGVFIGLIAGCIIGGRLTEFGRRSALLITNVVFLCSSVLSASAEGFMTLFIARLVTGVGVGMATVCVPLYISEFTPDASRGFYGTMHQLLITVGIFAGVLLGLFLGPSPADNQQDFVLSVFAQIWWRVMLGAPGLLALVGIILLWLVYPTETPHFLVVKNQKVTAKALLMELLGKEDVTLELETIERGVCQEKVLKSQSLSLARAFKFDAYRHVLLFAFFLSAFQQFTGINVLVANSNRLYESLALSPYLITSLTVGMSACNVLMTFPAVVLMDRLGRRTLLVWGVFGQFMCILIALVANFVDSSSLVVQWITVGGIYGFIVCFAIGYGPVLWVYLHEIFPPEIKQGGASAASAVNGIATIFIVLPSDYLFTVDIRIILGIFGAACLIAFIVALVFMKETMGLSVEESPYFKGKTRSMPKYFASTGLDHPANPVPALASGYFSVSQISASALPVKV